MSTRSLRNRVSSRFTSPTTAVDTEVAAPPDEVVKERNGDPTLDVWVEPAVRKMPPSYQDHRGLERVGVLEMQEPLGVPPSTKILQKLKLNISRPSPRATPMQTEGVSTPVLDAEKVDLPSPVDVEMLLELPQQEETVIISSPPRGRPAKRDVAEMKQSAYPMDVTPSPVKSSFTPSTQVSPKPHSIQEHLRQDRLQNYVERAIMEAEAAGDPGLVPGLKRIREAAHQNNQLWNVLDAVVHKTPSDDQLRTFKRFIKKGIKSHLKHLRASDTSSQTPSSINNFASPQQSVTANLDSFPILSPTPATSNTALTAITFTSPYRTRPAAFDLQYAQSQLQNLPLSPQQPPTPEMTMTQNALPTTEPAGKRSGSVSSSSSLSSAKSIPDEFAPTIEGGSALVAEGRSAKTGGQRQGTTRAVASKGLRSSSQNLPAPKHPFADLPSVNKLTAKRLKRIREDSDFDPEEVQKRRAEFEQQSFQNYNTLQHDEIEERHHVIGEDEPEISMITTEPRVAAPIVHQNSLNPVIAFAAQTNGHIHPDLTLANGFGHKRTFDEMVGGDEDAMSQKSSSPGPSFVPPPPVTANTTSRAATPRAAKLPAITKARKSARVMVSPNKPKNGGITAGISRASTIRDSVTGNGIESGPEDNNDYCASCGGEGTLLCCDGCPNSFHYGCLEPPLDPEKEVDGEWFCPRCLATRNKDPIPVTGMLGPLIRRLDDTIPKAFALPLDVREYFEGVRTGEEGEYEEIGLPRTQNNVVKMNRAGFIDEPNYKELRDSKGKLITCYLCGLSANGRDIIPCDFCPARWHLDCINPPLAVPPRRRIADKPNASWRCPLHTEQDFAGLGRQVEAAPGDLGRIPRLRKPKNALPIDITASRGFRNNGVIEIDMMKDEMPEIKEIDMGGGVFRLPEKGIRLDFIDRVKRSWYEDKSFPLHVGRPQKLRDRLYRPEGAVMHHEPQEIIIRTEEPDFFKSAQAIAIAETAKANAALRRKSFKEQQAVLNLAEFSQKGAIGFSGDYLADLTHQLVSEAPVEVANMMERSEIAGLKSLQELIGRRLALLEKTGAAAPANDKDKGKFFGRPRNTSSSTSLVNGDHRGSYYDDDGTNDGGSEMDVSVSDG